MRNDLDEIKAKLYCEGASVNHDELVWLVDQVERLEAAQMTGDRMTAAVERSTIAKQQSFAAGMEQAAKIADTADATANEGTGIIGKDDWLRGFKYAQRFVAAAIRADKERGDE